MEDFDSILLRVSKPLGNETLTVRHYVGYVEATYEPKFGKKISGFPIVKGVDFQDAIIRLDCIRRNEKCT